MAIVGNSITPGGGSSFAAIQVTYPAGSVCTCSNGTKTMTAKTTTGKYTFFIPKVTLPSTWTLSCSQGTDSDSQTATITAEGDLLTVILAYYKVPLNVNNWATISRAAQLGIGDTYWDIGDCKEIVLNGQIGNYLTLSNFTTYVYILDFNHPINKTIADNNIIFGGFKTSLAANAQDICLCDSEYGHRPRTTMIAFNINHFASSSAPGMSFAYGGWKGSDFRYDILGTVEFSPQGYCQAKGTDTTGYDATTAAITSPVPNTLMAALPSDFRNVLRLHTHYLMNNGSSSVMLNSGNTQSDSDITAVIDAGIFSLSEYEIFGTRTWAQIYEQNHQKQMQYYINGNSKVKYKQSGNAKAEYNTSSLAGGTFTLVDTSGSSDCINEYNGYGGFWIYGIAPAFKV